MVSRIFRFAWCTIVSCQHKCHQNHEVCEDGGCNVNTECTFPLQDLAGKTFTRMYEVEETYGYCTKNLVVTFTYTLSEKCGNMYSVTRAEKILDHCTGETKICKCLTWSSDNLNIGYDPSNPSKWLIFIQTSVMEAHYTVNEPDQFTVDVDTIRNNHIYHVISHRRSESAHVPLSTIVECTY